MSQTSENDILKSMETLYTEGRYDALLELLLQSKEVLSPGLFHFNLGTAYIKEGKLPAGRYNLEKAVKLGHVNSMTLNNLKYSIQELNVRDISTEQNYYSKFIDGAILVPFGTYTFLSLLLIVVLLITVKMRWLRSKLIMACFVIISILPVAFHQLYIKDLKVAIVLEEVTLMEGPSKIYKNIGSIDAGSKIILGKSHNGWYFIDFPEMNRGWVRKDNLAFL